MIEATVLALVAHGLFEMPIEVSYCLGYSMATVAGAIVVPSMLAFNDKGLGKAKGIPGTLIAASTFDNIECIIAYGIVHALAMNKASS